MPVVNTGSDPDVEIYFIDEGAGGEAILFCHGAGGNATSWWQQIPEFSGQYRTLAMDHRGYGRSPCAAQDFDVSQFGNDALAVLDGCGLEAAHFVCQSMGGWTGVQVALAHPERILSLTLSDTIGGIAIPSGIQSAMTVTERTVAGKSPALAPSFYETEPKMTFLYDSISAFNQLPLQAVVAGLFAENVLIDPERAATLTLPILVISSSEDLFWPPYVFDDLTALWPPCVCS